jgi:hypothetical protein
MADQLLILSGDDFISPVGRVSVAEWALVHECASRISLWGAVQDFIDAPKTTPLPMYCSTNSGRPQ